MAVVMGKKQGALFKKIDGRAWVLIRTPLLKSEKEKFQQRYYSALDSFPRGKATRETWQTLADAVNMSKSMCETGFGSSYKPLVESAIDALSACRDRFKLVGVWGLTGDQLTAIREVLHLVNAHNDSATLNQLSKAVSDVKRKINEGDIR